MTVSQIRAHFYFLVQVQVPKHEIHLKSLLIVKSVPTDTSCLELLALCSWKTRFCSHRAPTLALALKFCESGWKFRKLRLRRKLLPLSDTSTDRHREDEEDNVGDSVSDLICGVGKEKLEQEMAGIVFSVSYIKSFFSILDFSVGWKKVVIIKGTRSG